MAVVERVEAQLVADANQFIQGLEQAKAALGQLIPATQRLGVELRQAAQDFATGRISGEEWGKAILRLGPQLDLAETSLATVEQKTELLTAALLEGKITVQQFAAAAERMRAATGVATNLESIAPAATKAAMGTRRLENALTSVAFSAMPGMSGAAGFRSYPIYTRDKGMDLYFR